MRSPPKRTSRHAVARRAVGTEPLVPRKTTERSTAQTVSRRAAGTPESRSDARLCRLQYELPQRCNCPPIYQVIRSEPDSPALVIAGGLELQLHLEACCLLDGKEVHGAAWCVMGTQYISQAQIGQAPRPWSVVRLLKIRQPSRSRAALY